MRTDKIFRMAWKVAPKLPLSLVYAASDVAADLAWRRNGKSVRQMRRNYQLLTGKPVAEDQVRLGVRSYFRCFAQQFTLPGWSPQQIRTSTTYPAAPQTKELMESGPVVLALTHSGNWDLAGAWFCQNYGPILTVAEKLDPPELFDEFVKFRVSLGMEIIGVGPGEHVFPELVRRARGRSVLVPLLADRDISGRGVEVDLGHSKALVAAGPAALALALERPLIAGHISYKRNGSAWDIVTHFTDPITPPEPAKGENEVEALTRAWVRAIVPAMEEYFIDWHMMQKVFVDDLDQQRLERARRRVEEGSR